MSVPTYHVKHGVSIFISSVDERLRSEFFYEGFEFVEFAVASDQEEVFCVFRGWRWQGGGSHSSLECEVFAKVLRAR